MQLLTIDGTQWFCQFAPLCDVLEIHSRRRAWHLWDKQREYIGHFDTKAQLLEYIAKEGSL